MYLPRLGVMADWKVQCNMLICLLTKNIWLFDVVWFWAKSNGQGSLPCHLSRFMNAANVYFIYNSLNNGEMFVFLLIFQEIENSLLIYIFLRNKNQYVFILYYTMQNVPWWCNVTRGMKNVKSFNISRKIIVGISFNTFEINDILRINRYLANIKNVKYLNICFKLLNIFDLIFRKILIVSIE